MKLHLPKLLRNALLACISAVAGVALTKGSASAISVSEGYEGYVQSSFSTSASTSVETATGTWTYDAESQTLTIAAEAVNATTITFDMSLWGDEADFTGASIVHNNAGSSSTGIYAKQDGGIGGSWTADNSYWQDGSTNDIAGTTIEKLAGGDASIKVALTLSSTQGVKSVDVENGAVLYSASALKASSATWTTLGINKGLVSTIYYDTTTQGQKVSNASGTWSKVYATLAQNTVSEEKVDATLFISNARNQINGGVDGNGVKLSANGGDIIVGGAGHLYLQTWGAGEINLNNNLYIGSSTFSEGIYNTTNHGVIEIGNDGNSATNLYGKVYVVENSSIVSCADAGGAKAVNFHNTVTGNYALVVGGDNYHFKKEVNLATLTLTQGHWQSTHRTTGSMTFEDAVRVNELIVDSGVTVNFTNTSTLYVDQMEMVANSGVVNLNGGALKVSDLSRENYDVVGGTFRKTAAADGEAADNGYASTLQYTLISGSVTCTGTERLEGVDSIASVDGVGLVGTASTTDTTTFYVNNGVVVLGNDGYTDVASASTYIVAGGATLDTNQSLKDSENKHVILKEGATLARSGNDVGTGSIMLTKLTLEGDATVDLAKNYGLLGRGHNATALTLNGNTLDKKGAGTMYLVTTTADSGVIKISEGTVQAGHNGDNVVNLSNTAIELAGGTLNAVGTMKIASINGQGTISGTGQLHFIGTAASTLEGTFNVGSIHTEKTELTFGNGVDEAIATVGRMELGDSNPSGSHNVNIADNYKVVVTGTNNAANFKQASLLLGEWNSRTTLNVDGILLAKGASLLTGISGGALNVNQGGLVAVNGVSRARTDDNPNFTLNLATGGTLVLGAGGMNVEGSGTQSYNLNGGTVGISAAEVTIAESLNLAAKTDSIIDTALYSFSEDGTSITQGTDGGTLTISAAVGGAGTLIKQGAGTLKITGGTTDSFAGTFKVHSGALELGGNINIGGTIVNQGGALALENTTVNVINTTLLDKVDGGTYSDFNSQTGQNGFFTGKAYVVKGDYTQGLNFALQVGGETVTNFGKTDGGLTISLVDRDTYYVNTGTVTLTQTEEVAGFHIASGATLVYQDGDFSGDVITGSGVYDIGNKLSANLTGVTSGAWTGTVRISNATIGGGTFRFSNYGNAASATEFVGVSGWLPQASNMQALLKLGKGTAADNTVLNGINITAGSNWTHTFSGGVSGEGDFLVSNSGDGNPTYVFKGDMSGWTGAFRVDNASANKNITMKVENTGGVTNVNAGVECTNGSLTLEVIGSNGKAVFNKAVNATVLTINGHGEFTKDVTLSGNLKLTSDVNNHVVLHGTNNTVGSVDLSNNSSSAGKVELAQGASLTSQEALWMHVGASIQLQEAAAFTWDKTTVTGKAGGESAIKTSSTNAAQWMNMESLQILNADYELAWDEEKVVAAKLENSRIINGGTGLVTVTNSANTLSGVEAKLGNVVVQNSTTGSQVSLGAVTAADGKSVSAEMESAQASAITLGAGATFSTTGDLTLLDGSAISLGAGASISMDGTLTLGSGMALTISDVTKDTTLISGITSLDGSLDDIAAIFSSINGLTTLEDYSLSLEEGNLILVVDHGKIVSWDAANSTWENGAQFGATTEAVDTFANGDEVVFGALVADEAVTIKGALHALSMEVAAGEGKTYSFSADASGGTLSVPVLTITSGTAAFGSGTLQFDGLSAVTIAADGVLDLSAYYVGGSLAMISGITSGDGTVKYSGNDISNENDQVTWRVSLAGGLVFNTAVEVTKSLAINAYAIADKSTATVVVKKGLTVGDELRLESGAKLVVDNSTAEIGTISLCHVSSDDDYPGHVYVTGADASLKTSGIVLSKNYANTTSSFTMDGGMLEITSETGIASGIVTSITGGKLVANAASWGITGATIGGATVTDGELNCAVQIQTAGLDTEATDDDKTITLTNATLLGTLDNAAGKLALAGTVTINGAGFNVQTTLDDYSNGGTDGFATTDTYYQLVTNADNLTIADGTIWTMGKYVATGDKAGWVRVDGTEYGNVYYLNTADTTTLNDIKSHTSTTYTLSSIALNGGNLEYDVTDATVAINVQKNGIIKITDADTTDTTEVVLSSSQVTVDSGKEVTLTGNGVYDIGTALALAGNVSLDTAWTGTVRLGNAGSSSTELRLDLLGQSGSTVELTGVEGYFGNGYTVASNLKLTNTAGGVSALRLTNGNNGGTLTITGSVTGSGTLERGGDKGSNQKFVFAGDVQGWTGVFENSCTQSNIEISATVTFNGSNIINASIIDSNISDTAKNRLHVIIDDANITADDKSVTVNGSVASAYSLTLGLADDTNDSRAKVKLNNNVTVDTLANYATTTLDATHDTTDDNGEAAQAANVLTVGTLTNAGSLTVNGLLAVGAAVTNNGTLKLTQDTATLASLAGTGSVTAKSLTLQAATNTVGALTLDTLTLGVDAVKNADGVITTAGVASTLVTTGQLSVTGDVKVLTLGAGITETTGDVTTSYGMLKAAGLAGTLNFVIAEDELTRYMGTSNTLTLATITGLTTTDAVSLNKVAGNTQWSDTDHAWTDSEGQYTYKLSVDNGTLTLTRENLGIIWAGAKGEKWLMDVENDGVADTKAWTNKDGSQKLAYTGAESAIFDGKGITDVIISGDVETKNVSINAEGVTYTFTGDATTKLVVPEPADPENPETLINKEYDIIDTLTIQNKLSVLKGTLKADAGLDVYAVHSVEVLNGGAMELLSGASVHALAGISNAGTVTIGASSETQGAAALYVEGEGSVNNSGTMEVNGTLLAGYGMGVAAKGLNINNSGTLTNAGTIIADGNLDNSGTYTQTDGSLTVYGNVLNTGSVTETTPAGGMNITDGYAVVGGNLTNSGAMSISGGAQTRVDDLYEEDCDNLEVGGNLVNTGTFTVSGEGTKVTVGDVDNSGSIAVTGGSLNTGDVDNDGTLSVAGGSMTVTGDLDNRNKGSIAVSGGNLDITNDAGETITTVNNLDVTGDLLNADGTLSITGEGTKVAVGGNLQMQEGSVDDDTLLTGTLTVGEGTSLTVGGNLAAADMTLDFAGSVTVGGTASLKNLSIAENATFTAENATITGVLDNDGSLTVTTTEVKDETTGETSYTGGKLTIGTLTGSGEVHVAEGGALTIKGSMTEFTGLLDNKGSMTFDTTGKTDDEGNPIDAVVTLSNDQLKGHTAGDITTDALKVSDDAEGFNGGSYVMGDIKTDALVIEDIDAAGTAARLDMNSLAAKTTDGVVNITISADDMAAVVAAGKGSYDLISVGSVLSGLNLTNNDDLTTELMQTLLANGLNMELLPSEAAATAAVAAAEKTVVKLNVREQTVDESIWNFDGAHNTTEAGLIVLKDGKLATNVVLDNVQTVKVTDSQSLDLTGNISKVTLNGLTAVNADSSVAQQLTITGDAGDTAKVTTAASGYAGTLVLDKVTGTVIGQLDTVKLTNKAVANLDVTNTDVDALEAGLTLNGSMEGRKLSMSMSGVKGTLKIDGTDLNIAYDDGGKLTMNTVGVSKTGHVLVNMGQITGDEGDIFIGKNGVASKQIEKYFTNVRFEDKKGVVADRNAVYYTSKLADKATSDNGKTGLSMADEALLNANPQNSNATGDLATVLNQLDAMVATGNKAGADKLGASLAGASTAVLGMAAMGDVDRQLRAIRNRTTTMGVDQSVVNADMPYFNAWINAEGDSREMGEDETLGGYKLNSYGGTVGFDVDIEPTLTAGMALTAMYGDLDATGADKATGNLDSYYVSAFARYCGSAWTHTFVGTIGMGDISLDRTVNGTQVKGETDSMSFGLMYEVGRVYAMDEDGTTCLQPVFNVTWKHTTVDAYTEKGGDVALSVDEQSLDTITFGLGARLQAVVGESMYNRTSIFECRLLVKADAGDTEGTSKVALDGLSSHEVKSNEMGAVGVEIGAGLTIPLGDEGSSIFMDASAEIRSDYTDVNGTVGYRVNF